MACHKRSYLTRRRARVHKARIHADTGRKPYIYKCPDCDCYHMTTAGPKKRRRIRLSILNTKNTLGKKDD